MILGRSLLGRSKVNPLGPIFSTKSILPRQSSISRPLVLKLQSRFNSTSTATTAATQAAEKGTSAAAAAPQFDAALGFDSSATPVAEAVTTTLNSDQWGYLQSVGLGDGWFVGPIQQVYEAFHVLGLPWWATIVVATLACRAPLSYFAFKASDSVARSASIAPYMKELQKEVIAAQSAGDQKATHIANAKIKRLSAKAGVSAFTSIGGLLGQGGFSLLAFLGIREMANLPVQGFADQGILWFQNLAAADPYLGLHFISATTYTSAILLGGDTGAQQFGGNLRKFFMVAPFLSILVTYQFSSGVMLFLLTNGVVSLFQSRLFSHPGFRKWANMHPLQTQPQQGAGFMERMRENFEASKAAAEKKEASKVEDAIRFQNARSNAGRVITSKKKKMN